METRRKFLKKALYTTPLILTLAVRPSYANGTYGPSGGGGSTPRPTGGNEWWTFWSRR